MDRLADLDEKLDSLKVEMTDTCDPALQRAIRKTIFEMSGARKVIEELRGINDPGLSKEDFLTRISEVFDQNPEIARELSAQLAKG